MPQTKNTMIKFALKQRSGLNTGKSIYGDGAKATFGAGDRVRLRSFDVKDTVQRAENDALTGSVYQYGGEVVAQAATGSFECYIHPQHFGQLAYLALGYCGLSGPTKATGKLSHWFEVRALGRDQESYTAAESTLATANAKFSPAYNAGDIVQAYFDIGRSVGPYDEVARNSLVKSFEITAKAKEPLSIKCEFVAEYVEKDTARTTLSGITEKQDLLSKNIFEQYYLARHFDSVKFGPVGALVAVQLLDLSIKGAWDMGDETFVLGSLYRAAPVHAGPFSLEVEITINKHDDISWENLEKANTLCAFYAQATIGTNQVKILIPSLEVLTADPESGKDGSTVKVKGRAVLRQSREAFTTELGGYTPLYQSPIVIGTVVPDTTQADAYNPMRQ